MILEEKQRLLEEKQKKDQEFGSMRKCIEPHISKLTDENAKMR